MPEDQKTFPLGAKKSPPDLRDIHFASVVPPMTDSELPRKVSLRDRQSPVATQIYGSCEGFTAKDIREFLNPGIEVSGRAAYALCKELDGMPYEQGTWTRVMLKVACGIGIPLERYLPNVQTPTHQEYISGLTDEAREEAIENRLPGFAICNSIQDIKTALFKGFVVTGTIEVYNDYLSSQPNGKLNPHGPNLVGTHEISFIGYDDDIGGLEFKNHWGTGWGQSGYAFLPYDYLGNNHPFTEAYAIVDFIDGQLTSGAPIDLQYPLSGPINITQSFGARPEYYAKYGMAGHNGLDLHAASGTPVYAADAGKVVFSGYKGSVASGYGKYIMIQHTWGYSLYGHLDRFNVSDAAPPNGLPQNVNKGQLIGYSDNTGDSSAPHLHFGIRINGVKNPGYFDWVNPQPYLRKAIMTNSFFFQQGNTFGIGHPATNPEAIISDALNNGLEVPLKPGVPDTAPAGERIDWAQLAARSYKVNPMPGQSELPPTAEVPDEVIPS